jgi:hypothetical protein
MPYYSSSFYTQLIEPSWRLIVLELSLYTDNIVFNKPIYYSEDEGYKMEDENHNYRRGYESEDEDEKYGIEGLILELIDFSVDLLKRKAVVEALRSNLLTFLLTIKGYCLLPHNSIVLWKNNPNLYISEEFDDENINSVRNKSLNLIKEIAKEIDDQMLLRFLKIITSEFVEGVVIENYSEVIKLDDSNLIAPYIESLNSNHEYIIRRHEANLLILGTLSDDLYLLKEKNMLSREEVYQIIKFLFDIMTKETNSILIGRSIWCISRLISLVKYEPNILKEIFEGISFALCNPSSDLSVCLAAAQCLSSICLKLEEFDSEYIIKNFNRLIRLLTETSEETLLLPIESIYALSKLNKEKAIIVPLNASKLIVDIYSQYYNHPTLGVKILELVKLWCTDNRSAKLLMKLFVPFAIFVFADFFKSLGRDDQNFEQIRKTVMTEHGGNDLDFKTNVEMLPVSYNLTL